jgi:pSer/pThr/pTyr-binding forkhead associated (FHA) protein
VSGPDDKTKLAPRPPEGGEATSTKPLGQQPSGPTDDRTRSAVPDGDDRTHVIGGDERTRIAEPASADRSAAAQAPAEGAGDATRAMPAAPSAAPASSTPTAAKAPAAAPTPAASDERTRVMAGGSTPAAKPGAEGATIAMTQPKGTQAGAAAVVPPAAALGDDVTVVRPQTRRRPRLLTRDASSNVKEHALGDQEITIGRASTCQIVLTNPEVSRSHARIIQRPDGTLLKVLGERRNTYVNGQLVGSEHLLRHGDVVELANERLIYAEAAENPPFEAAAEGASAKRPFPIAAVAAAAVVAVVGLYLLLGGEEAPPPPAPVAQPAAPPPPAAPAVAEAVAPAVIAEVAPAAAEAAREAAAEAVREAAEKEAAKIAVQEREQRIGKLIYEADIAFLENRLTTPTEGSASYAYAEVLKLDPANEHAKTRIIAIIERYLGWAEEAKGRGNRQRARLYADKAHYVHGLAPGAGDAAAIESRITALGGGS